MCSTMLAARSFQVSSRQAIFLSTEALLIENLNTKLLVVLRERIGFKNDRLENIASRHVT